MENRIMTPPVIYTPHQEQIHAFLLAASYAESGNFYSSLPVKSVQDGVLFENEEIKVEARHNFHYGNMETMKEKVWRSFSYRIHCEGKVILFSGDVKGVEDLEDWPGTADLFLMETGHHDPLEVCRKLEEKFHSSLPHLLFMHHGRRILHNKPFYEEECPKLYHGKLSIAEDAMTLSL